MSRLEKNLYKRVKVESGPKKAAPGRTYRGFSSVSEHTENFALYDFELIKQDIINHFHIRQGEKLNDPQFGTIIWDVLFEPFTNNIRDAIVTDVTEIINYDPRVKVESIFVDTYDSGIEVSCTLSYLPYNISEELLFRFDQSLIQ